MQLTYFRPRGLSCAKIVGYRTDTGLRAAGTHATLQLILCIVLALIGVHLWVNMREIEEAHFSLCGPGTTLASFLSRARFLSDKPNTAQPCVSSVNLDSIHVLCTQRHVNKVNRPKHVSLRFVYDPSIVYTDHDEK